MTATDRDDPRPLILVSAAERSGDMHASRLVEETLRLRPELRFEGFGGELLRAKGCVLDADLVDIASMGTGFLKHLGRYARAIAGFHAKLHRSKPLAAVLVDSPGLNFILARLARWARVPVVYYICPQIWAWAPWRRAKILRYTDLILTILPFEEELYRNPRVPVRFVGHPLADTLELVPRDAGRLLRESLGIAPGARVLGVLPGSREAEVKGLLPFVARIASRLAAGGRISNLLISAFRPAFRPWIESALGSLGIPVHVLGEDPRAQVLAADVALVASGTASLETAYLGTPLVVLYRAGPLQLRAYEFLRVTPYFSLPNILGARFTGGGPSVLERFVGPEAEGEVEAEATRLLEPGLYRSAAVERLGRVREAIFLPGASRRAAESLVEFLSARGV